MRNLLATAATISLAAALGTAGGDEPEPSVTYVRTWDAAVEEAKLLTLPIVVHGHGFY